MKRFLGIILASLAACFIVSAAAVETPSEAEQLPVTVGCQSGDVKLLTDGIEKTYTTISDGDAVTITSDGAISSLYIIFDRIYGEWSLSDGTTTVTCGENSFLHEYVDVTEAFGYSPSSLTMTFRGGKCQLSEIYAFGSGDLPSWVQIWQPPCEEADLVLFSTHIDDEQLFFAGILPYYAGERGLSVQVVYFTSPFTYHDRPHEQLNGLWTVGVRNYPVCGELIDAYSETAKKAYSDQEKYGFSREDIVAFQVSMIRRFRPHVIVGHDINGEYSHGQHIINCETLMEALPLAADESYDPDSVSEYGVWDTPKTYIHLWKENEIIMDWDTPLEAFGGKTAFQVSQDGFMCHKSQHWTWFYSWIFGKSKTISKASEIKSYSPCRYGLYRTNVGPDVAGGDMFENIPMSYAEIKAEEERIREEESRAESERISLEESLAESESLRIEEESLRAEEESRRAEEESRRAEESSRSPIETGSSGTDVGTYVTGIVVVVIAAAISAALIIPQIKPKSNKGNGPRRRSQ